MGVGSVLGCVGTLFGQLCYENGTQEFWGVGSGEWGGGGRKMCFNTCVPQVKISQKLVAKNSIKLVIRIERFNYNIDIDVLYQAVN